MSKPTGHGHLGSTCCYEGILFMTSSGHTGHIPFNLLPFDEQVRNSNNYAEAYNSRSVIYEGYCADHGWGDFYLSTKKCAKCGKALGRPYKDENRANARRAGENQYLGDCAVHGENVAHSVLTGRCLGCYNVVGTKRAAKGPGRPRTEGPRAVARRSGEYVYIAWCERHGGPAEFSVQHGKCLICYNTAGAFRRT